MSHYEARATIRATPQTVWGVLTDPGRLVAGGLGITRLDGRIALGEKLALWTEAATDRVFRLRVTAFEPERRMVWEGGMPLGLFKGVRQFVLESTAGGVLFQMREDYSGLLHGLVSKAIPDLDPSFQKFAQGLKKLAEASTP